FYIILELGRVVAHPWHETPSCSTQIEFSHHGCVIRGPLPGSGGGIHIAGQAGFGQRRTGEDVIDSQSIIPALAETSVIPPGETLALFSIREASPRVFEAGIE